MDKYASRVRTPDENQAFLEEHPELLHEHCMGAWWRERSHACTLRGVGRDAAERVACGALGRGVSALMCASPASHAGYLLMEALTLGMDDKKARVAAQPHSRTPDADNALPGGDEARG
jgi:hypothetical protein